MIYKVLKAKTIKHSHLPDVQTGSLLKLYTLKPERQCRKLEIQAAKKIHQKKYHNRRVRERQRKDEQPTPIGPTRAAGQLNSNIHAITIQGMSNTKNIKKQQSPLNQRRTPKNIINVICLKDLHIHSVVRMLLGLVVTTFRWRDVSRGSIPGRSIFSASFRKVKNFGQQERGDTPTGLVLST